MVPADRPMGKLTLLKVDRPLLFFRGLVQWVGQAHIEPAKFAWDGGSTGLFIQRVLGVSRWISRSWAGPHVLPGLNMTLGIMSTGLGLILVPSFVPILLFFGIHYTSFCSVQS